MLTPASDTPGNADSAQSIRSILHRLLALDSMESTRTAQDKYEAVYALMEAIGCAFGSDRVYLFETLDAPLVFSNTNEWCAENVTPQIQNLQQLHAQDMPNWVALFQKGQYVLISNLEDIRDTMPQEYEILKPQDITNELAIPLYHANQLIGFMGMDNPRIECSEELILFMRLIGRYVGSSGVNAITLQRLEREKQFLEVLCREYTSVYYVNLTDGTAEILKLDGLANAAQIFRPDSGEKLDYAGMLHAYVTNFVLPENQSTLWENLQADALRKAIGEQGRFSIRFQTHPNAAGHEHFEAQIALVQNTPLEFGVMLGFRYIDDIIRQEQAHQKALEQALEEARLTNSILSALSKIYFSIYRIDLGQNYFEEISAEQEVHRFTGNHGDATQKMQEICERFVTPEYHDSVMKFFDLSTLPQRLRNDESIAQEYLAKDGNWHLARFIVKRRNAAGVPTHVLYVTRIISDTKRRERNLIVLAEEANRANQAKTDFLSRISHDIRTPMNALRGFTRIARASLDNPEQLRHSLDEIDIASHYLQQLAEDVLDLNQIENSQLQIHPQAFSLTEFLNHLEESISVLAREKGQHFSMEVAPILHEYVVGDSLRLHQVYMNLLSNAIKFTPEGGNILFTVTQQELPGGSSLRLVSTVQDTGIGMSPEFMAHMYDRFTRAVDTRINQVRGTGLGLAVVKELVDLMHGDIQAESVPGAGTTFTVTFTLPLGNAPELHAPPAPDCSGMHLLIAEDNDLNYEIVAELLEMHGISSTRAENGLVCVERFRSAEPDAFDAILMDIQMPVMDGIEATRCIRASDTPRAKTIPIIALTANAFGTDVAACRSAGMNAHLSKPFELNRLLTLLHTYVKGSKA